VFDRIAGGLFVGFTFSAMLLGHYYLTQPKMPIEELKRITLCYLVLCAIRILTVSFFAYKWVAISAKRIGLSS